MNMMVPTGALGPEAETKGNQGPDKAPHSLTRGVVRAGGEETRGRQVDKEGMIG